MADLLVRCATFGAGNTKPCANPPNGDSAPTRGATACALVMAFPVQPIGTLLSIRFAGVNLEWLELPCHYRFVAA